MAVALLAGLPQISIQAFVLAGHWIHFLHFFKYLVFNNLKFKKYRQYPSL
jgi:hypothetical protein